MKFRKSVPVCFLLAVVMLPLETFARVKLITLPVRERVEIQLDHANVTLVEEERIVPLVSGLNQIDFSWRNTAIDPDTIVFRTLETSEGDDFEVNVLSVSYPPNENALVWNVSSAAAGSVRVRISYVLGGLNKSFSYRAIAANDEKQLTLSQYLRVENYANETYDESSLWAGFGERFVQAVGLNETKKLLAEKYIDVPIKKTYTCDPAEFGYLDRAQDKLNVPMHYVLKNDQANKLGKAALPYGKVRIFQDDGKGTTAFIGEDWGKFTPLDDEMALYLGLAKDIAVKRTVDKNDRKRVTGNLYNYEIVLKFEIENFKDKPATLDVVEHIRRIRDELYGNNGREVSWKLGDKTTFKQGPNSEKSTFDKVVFHTDLPPRDDDGKAEKVTHYLHLIMENEWR
ncbi:MAG: hypothetical protein AAF512_17250 [Pseudomonadota bacterium]